MSVRWIIGDTRDVVAAMPDDSVDLVLTSPPFLALRSYLPPDHPDKWREIGTEATPATFIDTLLALTAEWGRVLTPTGTLAVELGDTYSGSSAVGGDEMRSGRGVDGTMRLRGANEGITRGRDGWPLAKSLALVPESYRLALAYGRNPLTGDESPAGRWRVRNVVDWCRPNPPVGALGDKYRPSTSDLVVACVSDRRWFDLDAVRTEGNPDAIGNRRTGKSRDTLQGGELGAYTAEMHAAGAPPLDHWIIPPGGYSGKVKSTRRERVPSEHAAACGAERTTSPDCPVHADLPGQLPKALRDEREAAQSPRTPRSDGRPDQAPLDGFASTDATPARSGSTPRPTTETTDPGCSPPATPHNTASSRTAPAPATTSPGTSSGRSPARTGDTSESLPCAEPRPGMPESRTSEDGSPEPLPSPAPRTAGTETGSSDSACTCSFWRVITEYTSHYAVFPPELCRIPIESMCPRRVCRTCGTPSRREVEASEGYAEKLGGTIAGRVGKAAESGLLGSTQPPGDHITSASYTTTGWSTCGCPGTDGIRLDGYHTGPGWRPGIVLDPFGGSGTTGMVASGLSRDAICVDVDDRNADLARSRIGMFLEVEDQRKASA